MTTPEAEVPTHTEQRGAFIVAHVLMGACGATLGSVTGGTFLGEGADPAIVAQRQGLLDQASNLSAAVTKKEAALDLLDDVKPITDPMIITLTGEIRADNSQIESLTTTADSLHTEAPMDPVGAGIGAAIGAVVFIAGMHLRQPFNRALSRILRPRNKTIVE